LPGVKDHGLRTGRIGCVGYGHGVGLGRMGAFMTARQGFNHRQILGHGFRNVKIRRLYG